MDLAVGVIIGGAFKGITDSLVNDILNPVARHLRRWTMRPWPA
ncbi:MAG: MscL family protein [Flavonifractor plautii]